MIISMPVETISKEKFILDNYPDEVREQLSREKVELSLWNCQEWSKIFMYMGNVKGVILCTKLQSYFKDKLKMI